MKHFPIDYDQTVHDASPYLHLFIDKEGRWFQNGAEIVHTGIYQQFNSMLEKTSDGGYQVRMGREKCRVEVEDAPFVVTSLIEEENNRLCIQLNDGSSEPFDPRRFWIGEENIPYCQVKDELFHARFSRPAYYQLARHIVSENDEFFFVLDGKRLPVTRLQS